MKIYEKLVVSMITGEVLEEVSFEYSGPVDMCKETSGQDDAAKRLGTITDQLNKDFQINFSGQKAILDNIDRSIKAVVAAGPSQYGFSAQEDAALRTQASEGTAGAYKMARQAQEGQLAAIGGGNQFLPSGTAAVLRANTANAAAAQEANQQLGITSAGWATGRQNYLTALNESNAEAQILDPAKYSQQALEGGKASFDAETQIAQMPTTGGVIGGILGSVAGAGLTAFTGGLGGSLGKGLGAAMGGAKS